MNQANQIRENWLQKCCDMLAHRFTPAGYTVPAVRVSVGFTSKGSQESNKSKRIGECWSNQSSTDGICQIFISPILSDALTVAATVAHELVHATIGNDKAHGPAFRKCALAIGLTGKMTNTTAGAEFAAWVVSTLLPAIGEYPHAALMMANRDKKQTTRLIKCTCTECGYVARTTAKWIEQAGAPICPCNGEAMTV